jgi:hypothetical protein
MVAGGVGDGDSYGGYRSRLVEVLQRKGVRDLAVLRAVRMVPRHLFVPESVRHRAYDDVALPIGSGQTISQPYVQARYLELIGLTGKEKVLEIGTGSGYQSESPIWPRPPEPCSRLPVYATSQSWWATARWAGGRLLPTTPSWCPPRHPRFRRL